MAHGCVERARLTPNEEKELIDRLIISFEKTPEAWAFTGYTLDGNGLELWVCNGRSFLSVYRPQRIGLSFKGRMRLWRHIHKLRHALEGLPNDQFGELVAGLPESKPEPKRLTWNPLVLVLGFSAGLSQGA